MACKGWLGNAASTASSGIVAAAFHSTATNAKSDRTHLKSLEVYCQSFLHFVRALIYVLESQVGLQMLRWAKSEQTKKCGEVYNISMVPSMCANFDKGRMKKKKYTDCVTMSLCPLVIWLLVSAANAHSDIVTISWMILSNAWHGLQRLARKRSFHRLVWHSGCCLSFNSYKREILQDTIEVIWSLLSILPAFCEGTALFWKAKSVDKCVGRFIEHFHGPQYVFKYCQRMTKTKCTDCVTMSLCP